MGLIASLIAQWCQPRMSLRNSRTVISPQVSRVLVVGKFPNPTFDYYFAARLSAPGMPPFKLLDIRNFDSRSVEADGAFVIIVRYASKAVSRWIRNHRDTLAAVAVFLDDDVSALITGREATLSYRYRLLRNSILPLRNLDGMIDELWVSTEMLARRLSYAEPRLLPPAPSPAMLPAAKPGSHSSQPITIAYHATAIHVDEHRFLAPIIRRVLQIRRNAEFEVFAEGRNAKIWFDLGLDRVTVRRSLPWQSYLKEHQDRSIDIMLVPVAPGHVNDCRAETKRIDIARLNAAAILSSCPAFANAEEGEILLAYDEALWEQHLIALIDDSKARAQSAMATRRRVETLISQFSAGIPWIMDRGP